LTLAGFPIHGSLP